MDNLIDKIENWKEEIKGTIDNYDKLGWLMDNNEVIDHLRKSIDCLDDASKAKESDNFKPRG